MKYLLKWVAVLSLSLLGAGVALAAEVSPQTVTGATTVDAAGAKALFDQGALFVDVRSDKDWAAGRVPDAVHIELKSRYSEEALAAESGKADPVVIYCNGESCLRSSEASAMAVGWGFQKVYYFRDGLPAWKAAGYPVE